MKLITRELVESLDLIVASPIHPLERQDIETIKLVGQDHKRVFEEWKSADLKEVQIFAVMMGYNRIFSHLSRGSPKRDERFIYGNMSVARNANSLSCYYGNVFENSISNDDRSVYFGGGQSSQATVFEKPIPFDPKKEFMLVRSPNNSVAVDQVLSAARLEERIILGEWVIMDEQGKRGAREFDITGKDAEQEALCDRYFLGQFETKISIVDYSGEINLKVNIAPALPAMEKLPSGGYQIIPGRDHGKLKQFKVEDAKPLQYFDPLTFDLNHTQFVEIIKPFKLEIEQKKREIQDYALIYTSPEEFLRGKRWAFNDAVTGFDYQAITRYKNHHLLE